MYFNTVNSNTMVIIKSERHILLPGLVNDSDPTPGNDTSLCWGIWNSLHSEWLATTCLTVSKYCAIVTFCYTLENIIYILNSDFKETNHHFKHVTIVSTLNQLGNSVLYEKNILDPNWILTYITKSLASRCQCLSL